MNRQSIGKLFLAGIVAGLPVFAAAMPGAQSAQVPNDRSAIKSDRAASTADYQAAKKLTDDFNQAAARTRAAHQTYMQKVSAHTTAEKSYGGKDARTQQAEKDQAAAKQEWLAREKEQADIETQRKAAIAKLKTADTKHANDVHKLESDEGHPKQ
jgi:hypothetical protein